MKLRHKILLVDDRKTNLAILEEILQDYNFLSVESGEEALTEAPEFNPDLILLDIMMPGIDGYEVCRQLRRHKKGRRTKIIMVSAKMKVSERLQAYQVGADDFITKPFDKDELLAKVKVYLRLKTVEEVDTLKSDLLNHLCRDTINPVVRIISPLMAVLDDKKGIPEDCRKQILKSYSEAITLQQLLEKAILLSSLKYGAIQLLPVLIDFVTVVSEVVEELMPKAEKNTLKIHQNYPKQAMVRIDVRELKRVIRNILDNAIRFSPKNGKIIVEISEADDQVYLSILDQGMGIDTMINLNKSEVLSSLLAINEDNVQWHGINLFLAQIIIFLHNGKIEVETIQYRGTNIVVVLPSAASVDKNGFDMETAIISANNNFFTEVESRI